MKIEYIYEAGVFGSYKNRNIETIDKTRRELNVAALNCVVEAHIDELAEVYLSMLNEIDKIVNSTFSKFLFINTSSYVLPKDSCNMRVLFNYVIDKEFKNDTKIYLNLLKHTYCNMFAAEYMSKLNEFYIPIANTNDKKYDAPQFAHATFHNVKEFCDLITKAGKKTEKILKKYEPIIKNIVPGLPSIPTTPKFVNIDCDLNYYSRELESLYNAIGLTASRPHYSSYSKAMNVNSATFEYPGKMQEGIHKMLNFDEIPISLDGIEFKKAYVYGEPVQYVQKGEKNNETVNPEISIINKFMESEDKSSKDKDLAEWQYICGTAYRWADIDSKEDEDEAPFEISNRLVFSL